MAKIYTQLKRYTVSNYHRNKELSKTLTIGQTMTDQSGAEATDINIIVKKLAMTGTIPGSSTPPMYVDMSEIPDNLRDMLEMSRNIEKHRNELPQALRSLSTAELLSTDPNRLSAMITEQERYNERHQKLPQHLRSLSRQDVLNLTDEQLNTMVNPPRPVDTTPKETTK